MGLVVLAVVLACHWPALNGGVLWDDDAHLTPPTLQSWSGLARIWTDFQSTQQYYPVLFSAFWVEHRLWGDFMPAYHLANVLWHTLSCCLLALLLRRLWSADAAPAGRAPPTAGWRVPPGAAWVAALLFAVHPVCVESVAWITEQKNTLSLFFYLAAAGAYLEFDRRRKVGWYAAATVLFLLAMGSKTITVTLPPALLVVLWWRRGRIALRRDVAPLIPWFVAAIGTGLLTSWIERTVVGAEGAEFELDLLQRTALAGRVVWFYLGKLVWPAGLEFFYPRWEVPPHGGVWFGYVAAALAVTAGLWSLRRRTRGPLAAWLLFVGGLFPVLGFFKVFFFKFSYVNDHFQYLACLGVIAGVAGGLGIGWARATRPLRTAGAVALAGVLVVLGVISNRLSTRYVDKETLARTALASNPQSWMAHHILGTTLSRAPDRHAEAIAEFQAALQLNPRYPNAHFGLGNELARLPGRQDEAIAEYERALELSPRYADVHNNLGLELSRLPGRTAEAIAHFELALRYKPDFAEAHGNLGNLLAAMPGRLPEAIAHYDAALRISPELAWVHCRLGFCYARMPGRESAARAEYIEALRLKPDYADAHNALGILYAQTGRLEQARAEWEQVLRIDPGYEAARRNLRRLDEAGGR